MRIIVGVSVIALASCTVANGPRMRPAGESISQRSVEEIAGCLALKMSGNGTFGLTVAETPTGKRLTTTMTVTGMKFVQSVATVDNLGPSRRVAISQLVSKAPPGIPVQHPFDVCL